MKKLIPNLMVLAGFLGGIVVIGYGVFKLFLLHWSAGLGGFSVCMIVGARMILDVMNDE